MDGTYNSEYCVNKLVIMGKLWYKYINVSNLVTYYLQFYINNVGGICMSKYILKRIVSSIVTLWVVVTATFILAHVIPGGPFDREKVLPPEILKNIQERYNLDKSLLWQYQDYIGDLIKLDLGPSFQQRGTSVNDIINRGFPVSAKLGAVAVSISLVFGIILGIISAYKQGKWQDNLAMFISTLGVTIPSFVIATLLIYFLGEKLRWFPVFGLSSPKHYIIPAMALAGFSMAFISRLIRSSLLEVIRQDYIRAARARGLSETSIVICTFIKKCNTSCNYLYRTTSSSNFNWKLCSRKNFYNTWSW